MRPRLVAQLEARLGSRIVRVRGTAGGDINEAYRLELANGELIFVKTNTEAPAGLFGAEAGGLAWLRAAGALKVPEVIAFDDTPGCAFLALEYLSPGEPSATHDELLGRGLAALHQAGAEAFGFDHDNFIGTLPQPNAPLAGWARFYRERRLEPLVQRAFDAGQCSAALVRRFEVVFGRLDTLVGPSEPPARLHGDLWGGNLYTLASGEPALIDPAVYGGHREIDLAMMKLFGGFGGRVFRAYEEAHPLSPGHEERVALYQLYPLLVHVNLFGGGYTGQLERALGRYT